MLIPQNLSVFSVGRKSLFNGAAESFNPVSIHLASDRGVSSRESTSPEISATFPRFGCKFVNILHEKSGLKKGGVCHES